MQWFVEIYTYINKIYFYHICVLYNCMCPMCICNIVSDRKCVHIQKGARRLEQFRSKQCTKYEHIINKYKYERNKETSAIKK